VGTVAATITPGGPRCCDKDDGVGPAEKAAKSRCTHAGSSERGASCWPAPPPPPLLLQLLRTAAAAGGGCGSCGGGRYGDEWAEVVCGGLGSSGGCDETDGRRTGGPRLPVSAEEEGFWGEVTVLLPEVSCGSRCGESKMRGLCARGGGGLDDIPPTSAQKMTMVAGENKQTKRGRRGINKFNGDNKNIRCTSTREDQHKATKRVKDT
jgi:hypothetical protein